MSSVTVSHTASDAYTCRGQGRCRPCVAPPRRTRREPLRASALAVLLAFLTFLAMSSPHRVHHLADATRSPQRVAYMHHKHHGHRHGHAAHPDPPAQQPYEKHASPSSDCVVLFLFQSLPIFAAACTVLAAPTVPQPFHVLAAWFRPLEVHTSPCQARGPPAIVF
jgi:hypothetical protein